MRIRLGRGPVVATVLTIAVVLALIGCGSTQHHHSRRAGRPDVRSAVAATTHNAAPRAAPQALVTAQTENRLAVVDLPSGRIIRWVTVPGNPEYASASHSFGGTVVVASAGSGTVTLLDRDTMRRVKVLHGFASPHIPAITPDDEYAYVTDDARGQLTVIGLSNNKILSRVSVGAGAHHLAISPDERQVWVALGQSARTIVILSAVVSHPPASRAVINPARAHVVGHLDPGYLAHDLNFTPDGARVWITSADTSYVGVFSVRTHRLLFRVPGGPPPQHVVFAGRFAYITSGYGSRIERVALNSGRVLERTPAPYGSFDLDVGSGYVVTSSLLRGTLATYSKQLRPLRFSRLAPSTEDVVVSRP
jgi:DNA-binding beta-propeller fold protein YncE